MAHSGKITELAKRKYCTPESTAFGSVFCYKAVKDDRSVIDALEQLSESHPMRGFDWY